MLDKHIEQLSKHATTGLFTDLLDQKGVDYVYVADLKINRPAGIVLGHCRTVECEAGPYDEENIEMGLGYLDQCSAGDVLIVLGSYEFAYFGELMSRLSAKRGLNGAIIFGATRDARFTAEHVTVLAHKYMPVDIKGRGRVKSTGKPIYYDGTEINEEMVVVADSDGAVFFNKNYLIDYANELLAELTHEQMLVEKISDGISVNEILKITKGF
jgi:regulator of RNase E activity RraA